MSVYIKDMDMPVDCLSCRIACDKENYGVIGRPGGCPLAEVTGDLISRADAITLLTKIVFDEPPYLDSETLCRLYAEEQINTLPSAEAVSMEEHVKELNDLASAWKNKFVNAEKRTEELYDETMEKVANECKTCKERLQNLRPSADAELVRCKDCKHWYNDADTGMACEFTNMGQPEDGYCNWGERKGGDDE